jgi:hypothetical protein
MGLPVAAGSDPSLLRTYLTGTITALFPIHVDEINKLRPAFPRHNQLPRLITRTWRLAALDTPGPVATSSPS